jgi:hypothetical protein
MSDAYRLYFMLPDSIAWAVPSGRHQPCLHGCVLEVSRTGLVTIEGPSRERVFDQARRFFRVHAKGHPPASIGAVLCSPRGGLSVHAVDPPVRVRRPARDGWSIAVGADVVFSPSPVIDIGAPELEPTG